MAHPRAGDSGDHTRRFPNLEAEVDTATETTNLLGPGSTDPDQAPAAAESWDGLDDFKGEPWWRAPSIYWLLGPYGLYTLAFGGILVPKLNLILALVCKQHFADRHIHDPSQHELPVSLGGDNPQCRIPAIQSKVATFMLILTFTTGLLSAVTAPRFGRLSDRYGRTRLLAISSAGGLIAELVTTLAAKFPETVDYKWLILGSVCDGMLGSFTAGGLLTQSYATDCTPPSKRAVRFGFVHSCLFLGLAFGPLLAGYLVKLTGSLISIFYVAMGCHVIFILVLGFITPESLSKRRLEAAREKHAKEKRMNSQVAGVWFSRLQRVNLFEPLRILWPRDPGTNFRIRLSLLAMALADMIIMGASISAGPVMILYSEYMFGWGNFEASIFVSALSLIRVVLLVFVFPIINYLARTLPARRRRARGIDVPDKNAGADTLDVWVMRIAFTGEVLACTGYILARNGRAFFASGMLMALGGIGSATMQATMTKLIPADKVGQFLGATGMLHAIARVVGPLMFNGIYAMTVGTFPQAFFMVLLGFFAFGLVMSFLVKKHVHWETPVNDETEPLTGQSVVPQPTDADQVVVL